MGAEAGVLGGHAAIRALGPLFRFTEVFLRDDASGGVSWSSTCRDSSAGEDSGGYASSAVSSSHHDSIIDDAASAEDLELAKQMDALGLPTSFKTNKEQRKHAATGEKMKVMRTKSTFVHNVTGVQVPEVSGRGEVIDSMPSQGSDGSGTMSLGSVAIQVKNELPHFDTDDTCNKAVIHSDSEPNNQDVDAVETVICNCDLSRINAKENTESGINPVDFRFSNYQENAVKNGVHLCYQDKKLCCEQGRDGNLEDTSSVCCVTESEEISIDGNPARCFSDGHKFVNGIEWGVFWDAFYMRNYYYNFRTQESTWHPPSGLEQSAVSFTSSKVNTDVSEEGSYFAFSGDDSNHQGALNVTNPSQEVQNGGKTPDGKTPADVVEEGTTPFQKVQNDGKTPTDLAEEGTCLSFGWDDNNPQGALKVTTASWEVQNDGKVSGQASQEVFSGVDYTTENFISDMDLSFLSGSSKNLDEHVEQTSCSETSASAKDFCAGSFCPPDTMDHVDRLASASNDTSAEENWFSVSEQVDMVSMSSALHSHHPVVKHSRKKKIKRIKSNQKILSGENKEYTLPESIEGLPTSLVKYWYQRYLLFSKFDHGVKVDEEGWFSVTPEAIARHHASRCGHGTVIDCFAGVGGNAIQFAMMSNHVIAIDIDPQKVDYAQHNATIYDVRSNIDFIKGDFFALASLLKADTVFMSPPWGGPDYAKVQIYDIQSMLKPHDGTFLFKTAMKIASTVVMFLPRNVDPNQLAELALLAHPPWELEVERNYLNGKLKGITAYFCHSSNKSLEDPSDMDL